VCRQRTPPSRNLSEGGVGDDASTEETPSVSRFERGRGVEAVDRGNPPPSRVSSERGVGGGVSTENPSVSHFERGRGWW
jgi:hypothetical protein